MPLRLTTLGTPVEAHGATSPEDYLARQAAFIARNKRLRPALPWRDPTEIADRVNARVSGGYWIVDCTCGNAPSTHPEWRIACCFECGAIYRHVRFPAQLTDIAAALIVRPMAHRHWSSDESVHQLRAENLVHVEGVS